MYRHTRETAVGPYPKRHGVTVAEVLVVLGIVGVLTALLLPAVQSARESARQITCRDRLRQIGLATHNHLSAHGAFPFTSVISGDRINGRSVVFRESVSPHRYLLAHLDPAIFEQLELKDDSVPYLDVAPSSESDSNRRLMTLRIAVFACPSDRVPPGGNSYRANMGIGPGIYHPDAFPDAIRPFDPGNRTGAFANGQSLRPQDFDDGLSNTATFCERLTGDGDRSSYTPWRDAFISPVEFNLAQQAIDACRDYASPNPPRHDSFMGWTWLFGGWNHTWYNHVMTPNSPVPDCGEGYNIAGGGEGLYAARSLHSGGVNAAFGDGAVKFVSESIDLTVWRAIGTRAGGEAVSFE